MSIVLTTTTLQTITPNASYSRVPAKVEEMLVLGNIAGLVTDVLTIKTYFDVQDDGKGVSSVVRTKQPMMARNASNQVVADQDYTREAAANNGLFNFIVTFPKNANKIYFDLDQGAGTDVISITLDAITHSFSR